MRVRRWYSNKNELVCASKSKLTDLETESFDFALVGGDFLKIGFFIPLMLSPGDFDVPASTTPVIATEE